MDTNIYEESAQRAWDAILGKVKELEASGMKRAEISRLLGHTGRSAVTNWLKESSTSRNASFPDMLRYIDVLGLDIQDYLPKSATIRRPAPNAPVEKADADGSVTIHVYALAGAGPAFDLEENDPLATIRVPLEYAMQCDSALLVKGDSMAWTIKSGGVVGVIRRNFDFVSGEVCRMKGSPSSASSWMPPAGNTSSAPIIPTRKSTQTAVCPSRNMPTSSWAVWSGSGRRCNFSNME